MHGRIDEGPFFLRKCVSCGGHAVRELRGTALTAAVVGNEDTRCSHDRAPVSSRVHKKTRVGARQKAFYPHAGFRFPTACYALRA